MRHQSSAMITCHKKHLVSRCIQRGYTLEEAMPCVVSQDGDQWTIDPSHPAYPQERSGGAGSELKRLLSMIGITSSPTCSCNQRARYMDKMGVEWCENNKATIVSWLREEASKRKLPFVDLAGYGILNLAIRRAKRAIDIRRKEKP